eukprot:g30802.t1
MEDPLRDRLVHNFGLFRNAFRKCVYQPALPRLQRLTNRKDSADDFKIDMKTGRKLSRPSRVHDAARRFVWSGPMLATPESENLSGAGEAIHFGLRFYRRGT